MFRQTYTDKRAAVQAIDNQIEKLRDRKMDIDIAMSDFIYSASEKQELTLTREAEQLDEKIDQLVAEGDALEAALNEWEKGIHAAVDPTLEMLMKQTADYLYYLYAELDKLIQHDQDLVLPSMQAKEALPEPFKMTFKQNNQIINVDLLALVRDTNFPSCKDPEAKNLLWKVNYAISVYHSLYIHFQSRKGRLSDVETALEQVVNDLKASLRLNKHYEGPKSIWHQFFGSATTSANETEGSNWLKQLTEAKEKFTAAVTEAPTEIPHKSQILHP